MSFGLRLSRCVCVRRISLDGKGNALNPVISSLFILLLIRNLPEVLYAELALCL